MKVPEATSVSLAGLILLLAICASGVLSGQAPPKFKMETLSVFRLFWTSPHTGSIDATAANEYHSRILQAVAAGFEPMATSTLWVFPPFARAPQVPGTNFKGFTNVPEARLHCIPLFGTQEYQRLVEIRNSMWATLAREFPEVRLWVVGHEQLLGFNDCSGRQLPLQDLLVFFVDALEGVNKVIKSQNPNAITIAHFLGPMGIPIFIRGQLVQPREIIAGIKFEIARRGHAQGTYFDKWVFELFPELSLDRYPEPSIPVSFGAGVATDLVLPHVAQGRIGDGSRWVTEIDVVNTSATLQTVTLMFFGSDGSPKLVGLKDYPTGPGGNIFRTSLSFSLPAGVSNAVVVDSAEREDRPVDVGWTLVQGTGGIKAGLVFRRVRGFGDNITIETSAGILPQSPVALIEFIPRVLTERAERPNAKRTDVGFALANPDPNAGASGIIELVGFGGKVIGSAPFTLAPRGHVAKFAFEFFGPIDANTPPGAYVEEYLRIRVTSGSVAGVGLRFDGAIISTLPTH